MIENSAIFRAFTWDSAPPSEVPAGCVHLWAVCLDARDSSDLLSFLPETELERANRFAFAYDRWRFIQSHAFLRRVLSRYVGIRPLEIEFSYGAHGKPSIADHLRHSRIEFNMSHCEGVALVAVTSQLAVGADVETVHPIPDYLTIARRFFAQKEYVTLAALPEVERCQAFFRCWTRKEAVIKAVGLGLSMPLHSFEVTLSADGPAGILSLEPGHTPFGDWSLIHLELFDDVVGAVAVPLRNAVAEGFLLSR